MKEILSKINKLVTPSKSAEKHKSNIANEILKRVFKEIDLWRSKVQKKNLKAFCLSLRVFLSFFCTHHHQISVRGT